VRICEGGRGVVGKNGRSSLQRVREIARVTCGSDGAHVAGGSGGRRWQEIAVSLEAGQGNRGFFFEGGESGFWRAGDGFVEEAASPGGRSSVDSWA
jgi:hypothetical protein